MTTSRLLFRATCALVLSTTACVQDPGLGPDLGDCADYPDTVYTYGQLGIGTCLAGPTDLEFFEIDGRTWLGITNADPFRLFTSGSVLLVALDSIDRSREVIDIVDLEAYALPLEAFVGRLDVSPQRGLAVVPTRLSEDAFTTTAPDQVWFVDISDPTQPGLLASRPFISAGADPFEVVIDEAFGRAFVLNATGNTISVIDLDASPPALLDPAPASIITDGVFDDADASGSRVETSTAIATTSTSDQVLVTDRWTATWIDSAVRVWLEEGDGLSRWNSGGGAYQASSFGIELSPDQSESLTSLSDPWIAPSSAELVAYFADAGTLYSAATDGSAGVWGGFTLALSGSDGWNTVLGGPSVVDLTGRVVMYFDARETENGPASIGLANTTDTITFASLDEPVLTPSAPYESLRQPSVLADPFTGTTRMWLSAWNGAEWTVGLTESVDGLTSWSPVSSVITVDGGHAAAPVVTWSGGRYQMWLSVSDGTSWDHAVSWSYDGMSWSEPEAIVASERPFELGQPPRAGLQLDETLAWRLEGDNVGPLNATVRAGEEQTFITQGFSIQIASGHEIGTNIAGEASSAGISPGSIVDINGLKTLYATVSSTEGTTQLAALRELNEGTWVTTASDIIPRGTGGHVDGVGSPVVFEHQGRWHMVYRALDGLRSTMRVAISDDGVQFTPTDTSVLGNEASFASQQEQPHSIVVLEDGTLRLWYAGSDGTRSRIGAADSTDGIRFTPVPFGSSSHQFDAGEPGTFDDSGVADPMVWRDGDTWRMWYSGFDGDTWSLGYATRDRDEPWVRRTLANTDVSTPVMSPLPNTYATTSVRSPVAYPHPSGNGWELWHAGSDGFKTRIGLAHALSGHVFPTPRFPTSGDTMQFVTRRGEFGRSNIELGQVIDGIQLPFSFSDDGATAAVIDPVRGLLFVVSQTSGSIIAVDIRDDSDDGFDDLNYMDIEAALRVRTTTDRVGFNDIHLGPDGLLYLAAQEPDAIITVDSSSIVDNDTKELTDVAAVTTLPMHDLTDDAGETTASGVGPAGLAMVPGRDLLLASHFRDNSLSVFDLSLGTSGEEIRYLRQVGENPHVIRISPDGTFAIIALYLGHIADGVASPSLAIVDLDPASPDYLTVTSRIVNR
jgi:predicted GH43/DUF377 family glycosyl hydrolase